MILKEYGTKNVSNANKITGKIGGYCTGIVEI